MLVNYWPVKLAAAANAPLTSAAGLRAAPWADVIIADMESSVFCRLPCTLRLQCLPT